MPHPSPVSWVPIHTDLNSLPASILQHIRQRMEERSIRVQDTIQFRHWLLTRPRAPQYEDWYKDFGSFILVGKGETPRSVLQPSMRPWGKKLATLGTSNLPDRGINLSKFKNGLLSTTDADLGVKTAEMRGVSWNEYAKSVTFVYEDVDGMSKRVSLIEPEVRKLWFMFENERGLSRHGSKTAEPGVHVVTPPPPTSLGSPKAPEIQPTFEGISQWLRKNEYTENNLPYAHELRGDLLDFHKFDDSRPSFGNRYIEISLKRPEGSYHDSEPDEPVDMEMRGDVDEAYLRFEDRKTQWEGKISFGKLAAWLIKNGK